MSLKPLKSKKRKPHDISSSTVKKAVRGIIKLTSESPELQNKLLDDQFPLFLQINCVKVPKNYQTILRLPLENSILTPDSEVCLIVADRKGIKNKEHEKHLDYYEELLRKKGVDNIKKIMTFHEFRTEYETFETKRKLVELYDYFLVEGKISGKVVKKAGKIFYKKRKVPISVKLQCTKLKEHIEKALKKTPIYLHSRGDSFMVQFGHSKMAVEELVGNVFGVISGLEGSFPGGFSNIRSLNLFAFRGIAIPIYLNLSLEAQRAEVPEREKISFRPSKVKDSSWLKELRGFQD